MFQILANLFFLQKLLATFIVKLIPPFAVHNIGKYFALKKAFYLASLEELKGDYLEFGVFTGSSLSCALICGEKNQSINDFYGFDSFDGFGELEEDDKHPFYTALNFKTDYEKVKSRLERQAGKNSNLKLIKGFFNETLDPSSPDHYGINKAAIILLDSDTLTSAKSCLNFCTSILQEGTILILDDFFSYRGSTEKGVYGAFIEWQEKNPNIVLRKVSDYGMGGVMYIVAKL